MIAVIFILALLLFVGWMVVYRHFKALQAANIHRIKQEQKEASLLYQLQEIKEKNRKLEEKLRKMQYEVHHENPTERHH